MAGRVLRQKSVSAFVLLRAATGATPDSRCIAGMGVDDVGDVACT